MPGRPAVAPELALSPFGPEHVTSFLELAAVEGWVVDCRELAFLRGACPQGCLTALVAGEPAGYITALRYARSAWIGNLLVAPQQRRQGVGRALMAAVLQRLDDSGCPTVWLTASNDGAPLYRSLGFVAIDTVCRWRISGTLTAPAPEAVDLESAQQLDRMGWGDSRQLLFAGGEQEAGWLFGSDAFLRCLPAGEGLLFGPWGGNTATGAGRLLEQIMARVSGAGVIHVDAPTMNPAAGRLLSGCGFREQGGTLLMYRGQRPAYRPELIYGLASLGSYG